MRQYVVDAFTDRLFHGNPAAVCLLKRWLPEELMRNIAEENRFSETAFAVRSGERYRLRWFTPGGEIDLCGHATLAAAFVILRFDQPQAQRVVFDTLSGALTVTRREDLLEMDFPAYALEQVPVTEQMTQAIGIEPVEAWLGRDLLCVLPCAEDVLRYTPDPELTKRLDGLLLHTTAQGRETDCVSRSFAPKLKVTEDQVCGSGHCHIAPYWMDRLHKDALVAFQASQRGGTVYCRREGNRVVLGGKAVLFAQAELQLPASVVQEG